MNSLATSEVRSGPSAAPALDPASWVRPELRQLSAYTLDRSPCRFKLDQNEMPFDLPQPVKQRILAPLAERSWGTYPGFNSDHLRGVISRHQGWPADGVLLGNGSGELLALTLEAILRPGEEVVGTAPSFSLYKLLILRCAGEPRFLAPRPDLNLPLAELEAEIERDPTRPLILCSPNNPTGEAVTPEALERLLERIQAPLLLDNAYHEFCEYDYTPLLSRYRQLMIFRTLSKAWTMAAWRLGYLLADPALVTELIKVKLPYNLNFASALAAEVALAAPHAVDRRVRTVIGRRPQWTQMFRQQGFEVFPSQTNFLLVRHPQAAFLNRGLAARGIRMRDVSGYPGLANCFRVSVGSGAALRATREALAELQSEAERPQAGGEAS
ncbi:MAG: histidinol-phosphate transaminase [Acidobacteriota bacterium]